MSRAAVSKKTKDQLLVISASETSAYILWLKHRVNILSGADRKSVENRLAMPLKCRKNHLIGDSMSLTEYLLSWLPMAVAFVVMIAVIYKAGGFKQQAHRARVEQLLDRIAIAVEKNQNNGTSRN
jgi:hypothetical protein